MAGDGEAARQVSFNVPVTIEAGGRVILGEPQGVQGALAGVVREHLATIEVQPARHDGAPLTSRMELAGTVLLLPVDPDQFEVQLRNVTVRPVLLDWRPPDYPRERLRAGVDGTVEMAVRIGPDGRIVETRVLSSTHGDFTKAVTTVLKQWRFAPLGDAGGLEVSVPFWFHGNWEPTVLKSFDCPRDPDASHVPGQDGCLGLVETTGARYRRKGARARVVP